MHISLVHNAAAGTAQKIDADALAAQIREHGHEVRPCETSDLDAALAPPVDLVAVAGGDGTVAQVARRLSGSATPLTLLPLGTANNIARSFDVADIALADLISGWSQARVHAVDVGVIDGACGSRRFIEAVGLGLFAGAMAGIDRAEALAHLPTPERRVIHALRLMERAIDSLPGRPVELTIDGVTVSGEFLLLEIMNLRFVGPRLYLAPDGDAGDGQLDVVLVPAADREALRAALSSWRSGALEDAGLWTRRGRHLRLRWQGGPLHIDDQTWPAAADACAPPATLELRCQRGALRVLLPAR